MSTNCVLKEKQRGRAASKAARSAPEANQKPDREPSSSTESPESLRATQQASRMQAIGQLAGGIAHDFNNLLTVILGHSEFLLKGKESQKVSRSRVEEIRKAAERGAWLTNQLLAYSRNQILEPALLQINSVLEDVDGILRRVLGEDISLDLVVDPNLGWTKVDPGKLQQIVLNLAGNARDAMPQGGRLQIETLNLSVSDDEKKPQPYIAPGEYVAMVVSDSGHGMGAETRVRIFEPFFTTKEKGKGTGLGLATVYGIVKQSGGYIWVESEIGRGSTFYTLLPRAPAPSGPRMKQELLDFRSGGETILLVEDDPAVRTMSAEVLCGAGYHVLVAAGGSDALRLAESHNGPLDLLLTDIVMPGMTGVELADRFLVQCPSARVLYMTGYTDDAIARRGLQRLAEHVLQKPFTHQALARRVWEALEPSRLP